MIVSAMRTALLLLPSAMLALGGCAGYQLGNEGLYPRHIHTVYVPTFDSTSFRRDLGERLTEAVVKEIELKTPYKVVGTPDADSVLTGVLVDEGKRVVAQNRYGDARQVEARMQVLVNWIDRRGVALREGGAIELPPPAVAVGATADMMPEVGQSVATTQQQAIQSVAEQIVSMMEAPWGGKE
ncbi:MAG: hypothetical protein JW809_07485 [Pirellulales bacterium]|nr:hypothetical protein [Pirellulales bacterium]